jgi:transcriptional regulator GlxA family with amidase domain
VHALICLILRDIPDSFWPTPPADPRIQNALQTLDEQFGATIANPSLARAAGLATSSFLRLFTRQVGEPPQRYLMRRRIEQAPLLTRTPSADRTEKARRELHQSRTRRM